MNILELNHISHSYPGGKAAIKDLSLQLTKGDFTCLLGPSGCGKSSLLRLIAGLIRTQAGEIILDGQCVAAKRLHIPPEKRKIGMMFQDYALFPHLTVMENILYGITKRERDEKTQLAKKALRDIGIEDLQKSYPHTLSGGQQQRVALLRAMAPKPRLMLLDEPFSGLDISLRMEMREQIGGLLKKDGVTTLMVTHDPEEAMFMADRILIMKGGELLQSGSPEEIYHLPQSEYVAGLFGQINRLQGRVEDGRVKTSIGVVASSDLKDGTRVNVLIRPEAFSLNGSGKNSTIEARVQNARLLGHNSQLRLTVLTESLEEISLLARIDGHLGVKSGSPVAISLNPQQIFVFKA